MSKWRSFLFDQGNKWMMRLFYFFFFFTYLFAWLSPNLKMGDNAFFGTSTTLFLPFFFVTILLVVALIFSVPLVRKYVHWIVIEKKVWTASFLFLIGIVAQIWFIKNFHPVPGWDVSAIHMGLVHPEDRAIQSYFSLNQNNLPILLLQVKLSQIFGSQSWLFFDYLTLFFVDIAAMMIIGSATVMKRKNYAVTTYLVTLLLAVFPWIVVPYTDTWVLPLVSGMLLMYALSQKVTHFWGQVLCWMGVVLFSVGCYFMKPSTIIPLIAILCIEGLYAVQTTRKWRRKTVLSTVSIVLLACLTGIGSYHFIQKKIQTQQQITIDQNRGIPMIHFINTGLSEDGAYDPQAALKMITLPTKQEKIAYSKMEIRQRLSDRGFLGTVHFLIEKHRNNSADGTFAWGKEGTFFQENQKPASKAGWTGILKHSLFIYGDYIANFRVIAQMVWLILLSLIFFGWRGKTKVEQMLRLALIGSFLFLLIFEGGRSRYLLQFLPMVLLLSALNAEHSWRVIKEFSRKVSYSANEKTN